MPGGRLHTVDAKKVKARAAELGFDMAGIVRASEFDLPEPFRPWTRSVIVLGIATLDDGFDYSITIEYDGSRHWSKHIYEFLEAKAATLAFWLIDQGFQARPLRFENSIAIIDLKKAAVLAGFGVFGKNNVVVHRTFGPRVRFVCVFTNADLEPDRPVTEYYCTSCSQCIGACPENALLTSGLIRSRCIAEFDPDEEMLKRQKAKNEHATFHTWLQCNKCLTSCIIGKRIATSTFYKIRSGGD